MARSCTVAEVESFIRAAVPGHTLTYFIAVAGMESLASRLHTGASSTLRHVVKQVRALANEGQVDLVQKREGSMIHYRAIWRERPVKLGVTYRFEDAA